MNVIETASIVHKWSVLNEFKFSKTKEACMQCRTRFLNGGPMKVVKETKFLALIFYTKLTFMPH